MVTTLPPDGVQTGVDQGASRPGGASPGPEVGEQIRRTALVHSPPLPVDLLRLARSLVAAVPRWHEHLDQVGRSWKLIASSKAFEAWLILWPPGTAIGLHDHRASAGAMSMAEGVLSESYVSRDRTERSVLGHRRLHAGQSVSFPVGHVHSIMNRSQLAARSVHVYAPTLRTMTYHRLSGGVIEALVTKELDAVGVPA
ncbi:MAG TPA: cysteine dioxygenase family protein [Acidimicrobiales bacterium]|nr:cysteine dioxygenase family protein [Acidimicrobiales bacterium]